MIGPRKQWIRRLMMLCIAYAAFMLVAVYLEQRSLFQPPIRAVQKPLANEVLLPGGIACHWRPQARREAPVLLIAHGNAEDLTASQWYVDEAHRRGWHVAMFDYPGYGRSPGTPTEQGCYRAIQATYDFVRDQGLRPEQIIVLGRSVGGGSAAWLASRVPVAGLILESTFVSAHKVMVPFRVLPWTRFPVETYVEHGSYPVLIMHGEQDRTIAPWHGKKLKQLLGDRARLHMVKDAGHNDLLLLAGEDYWNWLASFAKQVQAGVLVTSASP